jgi:SAM-dependent methyltransferase
MSGTTDGGIAAAQEQGDVETCLAYFQSLGLPPGGRALDIGCRHGSFLRRLRMIGYDDVYGVDVDLAALEAGRAAYPDLADRLRHYDGLRLPFPDGGFDLVTMFDVIEHIPAPSDYLRDVRRVLKPGGRLVFQTPNILIDVPYWVLALRLFTHEKLAWLFAEHCSLQTLFSLRRLLADAGLDEIRIDKMPVDTPFKTEYMRRTLGAPGLALLRLANHFPLVLTPNFWGSCRRPD